MIEIEKFRSQVETLDTLMQAKLGVRGKSVSARFKRAGRLLPKRVHKAGRIIAEAESAVANPKLARLHDEATLNAAFADVAAFLKTIDPADLRRGKVLGMLGGMVFNLILLVVVIIALLYWQGLI